jgi:hypothetical protein
MAYKQLWEGIDFPFSFFQSNEFYLLQEEKELEPITKDR